MGISLTFCFGNLFLIWGVTFGNHWSVFGYFFRLSPFRLPVLQQNENSHSHSRRYCCDCGPLRDPLAVPALEHVKLQLFEIIEIILACKHKFVLMSNALDNGL